MMFVKDIMIKDPITTNKEISIKECVNILFKKHIGAVVVIDDERRIVGIFTERDLIRIIAQDMSLNAELKDVMTTNVVTISGGSSFAESKELMRLYRIRRIPVVDENSKLIGLISLRNIIDEFFEIIPKTRVP
jgi:CBS domain-containing protein